MLKGSAHFGAECRQGGGGCTLEWLGGKHLANIAVAYRSFDQGSQFGYPPFLSNSCHSAGCPQVHHSFVHMFNELLHEQSLFEVHRCVILYPTNALENVRSLILDKFPAWFL